MVVILNNYSILHQVNSIYRYETNPHRIYHKSHQGKVTGKNFNISYTTKEDMNNRKITKPEDIPVDFDWDAIYRIDEQTKTKDLDTIEDIKEVLVIVAGYIFLPHIAGGKRTNRQKLISLKALAAFISLLGNKMGTKNIAAILRASGLKIRSLELYQQIQVFKRYIKNEDYKSTAVNKLIKKKK